MSASAVLHRGVDRGLNPEDTRDGSGLNEAFLWPH